VSALRPGAGSPEVDSAADRPAVFHRLNNQLGVALASAELLEAKAVAQVDRARAAQIVESVIAALGTVRELSQRTEPPAPRGTTRNTATS
jgi:hypothetical protein